jgi:hypothetical protein
MVSLLFLMFFMTFAAQASSSDSGIEGVITVSPSQPGPAKAGGSNSAPVAQVDFLVKNESGVEASFTTDAEGHFRISLPAGRYTVSVKGRKIRRCGPFEVEVGAGKMTTVEWQCDSGMR